MSSNLLTRSREQLEYVRLIRRELHRFLRSVQNCPGPGLWCCANWAS